MTLTAPVAPVEPDVDRSPRPGVSALAEHAGTAAVLAALAWWATYLVWGTGGREPHRLSTAAALLLLAMLLVRPWRVLPTITLVLGNAIGLSAFVVVLTAPTGLAGADDAASYAYAGQLGLVVLAWARTASRRLVLVGCLVAAGGMEFAQGWLPWWGGQDTTKLFEGTFYWHNQAGIFLAAGALLAFAVVAAGFRPLSMLGWVAAPLCSAGVLFTTSRGAELALAIGVLLLSGVTLVSPVRRSAGPRLLGVFGASVLVTYALAGPPFFPHRMSPLAGTAERSPSLVGNGVQRLEDWRLAGAIFRHWPFSGAGFHSFSSATSIVTTKRDGATTAFAHNGFLQALSDGGIVLALPLFLAVAAVLVCGLRALPAAVRRGDLLLPGAVITLVVLLLHSGMDFDWSYPALLSLAALVAVLCLPIPGRPVVPHSSGRWLFCGLGAILLMASVVGAWHGGLDLNAVVPSRS